MLNNAASGANRRINLGKDLPCAARSLHQSQINACSRSANARLGRRPERQFQRHPRERQADENRASDGVHPLPKGSPEGCKQHRGNDQAPQPQTAGPHRNVFQIAQIKPPVLDRVHHALRGKQAVLAQIPPRAASQAANARYFAECTSQSVPRCHPSCQERNAD